MRPLEYPEKEKKPTRCCGTFDWLFNHNMAAELVGSVYCVFGTTGVSKINYCPFCGKQIETSITR